MITVKHSINLPDTYPLDRIGPLKGLLFFDIETTGFSGDTSRLYLIGCTYRDSFDWGLIQWFADLRESERELLTAFFTFVKCFKILVHFNGDGFNIPYLLKCCRRLDLLHDSACIKSVDIYEKIKPCRKLLGLENMKQKSTGQPPGVARDDEYNGGQLIEVHREYLMTHESFLFDLLTLRSEDNLKGMPSILPVLSYVGMIEAPFSLESQQLFTYNDITRNTCPFPSLILKSPCTIPVLLEYDSMPVSLELSRDTSVYSTTLFQGGLKYFYSSYKDYYYLPMEDTVTHKSVGEYVNRGAHAKATARACCIRKQGLFLPQFGCLWSPILMREYKTSLTHAEYEPEMLSPDDVADTYAKQILSYVSQARELQPPAGII